ncbi:hypothetical protein LX36DRAFT_698202 [Colletotrichum falcatum]|nr:hypothetical protein LX36DRAFT_698202 [Colletotrichum falcatum]
MGGHLSAMRFNIGVADRQAHLFFFFFFFFCFLFVVVVVISGLPYEYTRSSVLFVGFRPLASVGNPVIECRSDSASAAQTHRRVHLEHTLLRVARQRPRESGKTPRGVQVIWQIKWDSDDNVLEAAQPSSLSYPIGQRWPAEAFKHVPVSLAKGKRRLLLL